MRFSWIIKKLIEIDFIIIIEIDFLDEIKIACHTYRP